MTGGGGPLRPTFLSDLHGRELRSTRDYELVLYDRLTDEERRPLGDVSHETELYGILRPLRPALPTKVVDRDTALLFLTLQQPGPLPSYVRRSLGDHASSVIARLVFDHVLEIKDGDDFVTGAAAGSLIGAQQYAARNRLAELSVAALQYAQDLPIDDASVLASRLYAYNTVPISLRWRATLGTREAIHDHLQSASVRSGWKVTASTDAYWETWSRTNEQRPWTHKLYLSPTPHSLGSAFPRIVEALAATQTAHFKVGTTVHALFRPDKIVAYYESYEALALAAEQLTERLQDIPAQAVPFTAAIDADGLSSWGVDPPMPSGTSRSVRGSSWRQWLTKRLAQAMLEARRAGIDEPWRHALARLAVEGIDVERWTPSLALWRTTA